MKLSIFKRCAMLCLALMLGCADFLDVNQNPNNPETVPPSTLLPTGLAGTAFANNNELNRFASVVTSYLTGAGNAPAAYDTYVLNGGNFGNQWNTEIYGGALIAYKKMIELADDLGAKSYSGIGKIMMAYTFSIATDVWGDIPYSEALRGDDGITQPRLDLQEDIYKGNPTLEIKSLFDLVREGIADLNATSTLNPSTDDIVYGGNIANWKKAGNTLLLKLAMQISSREPALATSIINQVIAGDDYIKNNSENLGVKFGSSTGSQSPAYTYTNVSLFRNDMLVSTRYLNRLQALNDPRLDKFVTRPSGSFVTVDNGFSGTFPTPNTTWSKWSDIVLGPGGIGPVKLLTNAQRAFLLAEAATILPGINLPSGQTPNTLFQEGIRASMLDMPSSTGLTVAQINAYFNDAANTNFVNLTGSQTAQQEQIITQKYIAMTGNGLEAWNDWRRTGFPTLPPHQNAAGEDGTRPVRARYLDSELARNPNFIPALKKTNERVWWDVN